MNLSAEIESALIAYLQDRCTPEEARLLEQWLEQDPAHAELLYGLRHLYACRPADGSDRVDVDAMRRRLLARPEFRAGGESRAQAAPAVPVRKKRTVWVRLVGYAAGAAALIAVGGFIGGSLRSDGEPICNEIQVAAGSRSDLVLSDGTRVVMKASSKLRYPARFTGSQREVWLDGEAYFEVEHDAAHPFVVHAQGQDVRVLGTTFNVQSYANEEVNTVTLLTGAVGLDLLDDEGHVLRTLRLDPNRQCRYDRRSGSYTLSDLDSYDRQRSWSDGIYRFRNQTLAQIAARLQNYYGVKISPADESVGQISFTGSFSLTERLDEVFDILNHDDLLEITRDGDLYRIAKR